MKLRWQISSCIAVSAWSLLSAQALRAEPICSRGMMAISTFGPDQLVGKAFTATFRATHHQKLSDGSSVDTYADFHLARNSLGSTRYETPQRCYVKPSGETALAYTVTQYDAPTNTRVSWEVNGAVLGWDEKTVYVEQDGLHPEPEPPVRPRPPQAPSRTHQKQEDLGLKTIAGVEARGHRLTTIIPPGEEGNEQEIHIVHEWWYSELLATTVRAEDDDPREGHNTFEIENLQQGEPPPGTFDLPIGAERKPIHHV